MTNEEIRNLALECGASEDVYKDFESYFTFDVTELSSYTAAIEARERERCIVACQGQNGFQNCIERIRELK